MEHDLRADLNMILAPIKDRYLLRAVRRASLAVEDVFTEAEDILGALRVGSPRISILEPESDDLVAQLIRRMGSKLPILEIAPHDLRTLRYSTTSIATRQIDIDPVRLRRMIEQVARPMGWVDRVLRDLGQLAGRPLPLELRALARRVLEFPPSICVDRRGLRDGRIDARGHESAVQTPWVAVSVRIHGPIEGVVCV